jgi:hypothetical protein
MAGLAGANREIREAERREQERRSANAQRPKRLTDRLLVQLEEFNLAGVRNVPAWFQPMLVQLTEALTLWPGAEARFGPRLRSGLRTTAVIATVFDIQAMISPASGEHGALTDDEEDALTLPEAWPWSLGGVRH